VTEVGQPQSATIRHLNAAAASVARAVRASRVACVPSGLAGPG
jgi:hypothetical protein